MRFVRSIGALACLLALMLAPLALLAGCANTFGIRVPGFEQLGQASGLARSDEEKIAAVLDDVHRGMQNRQIYKVLANVSRNYYDGEGRDYNAIEADLAELFKKYREIRITRVTPRIQVQGDYAKAIETFGTVAEPNDPTAEPPISLQGQVAVTLEKVGGNWQIVEWGGML
jgi:hypothetical protein